MSNELPLDTVETVCRRDCFSTVVQQDYEGQVAGTRVADSRLDPILSDYLRQLAAAGRFRIVGDNGKMVVGYWPELDPTKQP